MSKEKEVVETKRKRPVRRDLTPGPLDSWIPAERPGFHQHICVTQVDATGASGKLDTYLNELGYTHRLDENGKPIIRTTKGNEKVFVLECPEELWDEALQTRRVKTQEKKDALKRVTTPFSKNNEKAELTQGKQ